MSDFDTFARAVGLVEDSERLEALGFPRRDFDDNGRFATDRLPKLLAFCEQHPEYHIVTQCDECYSNQVRFVNRLCYFLADGSKDLDLYIDACRVCDSYDCSCEEFYREWVSAGRPGQSFTKWLVQCKGLEEDQAEYYIDPEADGDDEEWPDTNHATDWRREGF